MKKTFFLDGHPEARARCAAYALVAPAGWMAVFSEPTKKRAQEERYHAMIAEIAEQSDYAGRHWHSDDMKRLLVDEFAEEMRGAGRPLHHDSRVVPSEDGRRVIQLGIQTSSFYVKEAAEFITFLQAWGDLRGVVFSEPSTNT